MSSGFGGLVRPTIARALRGMGIVAPNAMQASALPVAFSGKDVMCVPENPYASKGGLASVAQPHLLDNAITSGSRSDSSASRRANKLKAGLAAMVANRPPNETRRGRPGTLRAAGQGWR